MRGWIILDGLIGFGGLSAVVSGITSSIGMKGLSAIALLLLILTFMARYVRGRA